MIPIEIAMTSLLTNLTEAIANERVDHLAPGQVFERSRKGHTDTLTDTMGSTETRTTSLGPVGIGLPNWIKVSTYPSMAS